MNVFLSLFVVGRGICVEIQKHSVVNMSDAKSGSQPERGGFGYRNESHDQVPGSAPREVEGAAALRARAVPEVAARSAARGSAARVAAEELARWAGQFASGCGACCGECRLQMVTHITVGSRN